jgi:ribosome-associated protein
LAVFILEKQVLFFSTPAGHTARTAGDIMTPKPADSDAILAAVLKSLQDDKGEDIVEISLKGKSEIGDHMVIASGRSTRQVTAMAEKMVERLKIDLNVFSKMEGRTTGDWVLIDTGDVIVHIFRPEVREFYQLEKMWQPGMSPATTE